MVFLLIVIFSYIQILEASIDKTEANKKQGFPGNSIFENYGDENINILSGNLTIVHPNSSLLPVDGNFSYQLQRIYNSKIWALDEDICATGPSEGALGAALVSRSSMGVGWTFHLGRIYFTKPYESSNAYEKYFYEAADGSTHRLIGPTN